MTRNSIFRLLPLVFTAMCAASGLAQSLKLASPALDGGTLSTVLPSNSVSHLSIHGTDLWIGTGKGLARTKDGGTTWESFGALPQFANPGIFALAIKGDTIWAATGFDKEVSGSSVQTGSGYAFSTDNGATWTGLPQTMDSRSDTIVLYGSNRVHFLPIVVPEQNVTFDVALIDSTVWIASWSSGLRRSTDLGRTWPEQWRTVLPSGGRSSIAPSDSLGTYIVDPRNDNNFLLFSVFAENSSTIWAGTAGGVNRSTDGGTSWVNMNFENQASHILGNWVIAIGAQPYSAGTRVWTTNWPTDRAGEAYGVSYSDDGGRIWKNALRDVKSYAFAFKGPIVYIATESGIYRSADGAQSWTKSGTIIDFTTGNQIATDVFYSVGVVGDTVFAGSADGLVSTVDNSTHPFGESWQVKRSYRTVGATSTTYAYPNPFSPRFDVSRVHYNSGPAGGSVTVELFDFGMNRVKTITKDAQRPSGEHDEIWDGTNDAGAGVPNGVYFYRVIVNGGTPSWGKIMVIQ